MSEEPVAKEEKAGAAMTTAAMATAAAAVLHSSSPPSLVADGVPSIIIQDSFIVEKPSLSPSASPSSSKLNSNTVPVPKARNTKNYEVSVEADLSAIVPQARHRKDLATVEEMPTMEVYSQPAGEEANAEFDTGQSLSARPRMSSSPPSPSSFPVGVVMNEHVARPPPVPKPRRSPLPPSSTNELFLPSSDETFHPVAPPENEISPSQISPIQLNPFDSDDEEYSVSEDNDRSFEDNDRGDILDLTYNPGQSSNAIILSNFEECDESMLNEDSVCEMLENVIKEHDHLTAEAPPPKPASSSNALEMFNEEWNEADDDRMEAESTVDFFNDQTVQLSPVEKIAEDLVRVASLQTSGRDEDTPINSSPKEIRRDRLFSLFSIPPSETDTEQKSSGIIELDWLDDSNADGSQGFGGSHQLSSALTGASNSDHAKTIDSAVYVTGEEDIRPHDVNSSLSDSSPSSNFKEALNRPLVAHLLPLEAVFTPPPATPQLLKLSVQTPLSAQSTGSNLARQDQLAWDDYDMAVKAETPEVTGGRRSIVPIEIADQEAKARRKRISLAPCLKTLTLESHTNDQSAGSPITEDDEDDDGAGEQAGKNSLPIETSLALSLPRHLIKNQTKRKEKEIS